MVARGNGPGDGTRRSLRGRCVRNQHATPPSSCSLPKWNRGRTEALLFQLEARVCLVRQELASATDHPRRVAYELLAELAFPRLDVIIPPAITPARKFLMLRILTRSVSEGYTPGPSLTLRVSMTFFVAGIIIGVGAWYVSVMPRPPIPSPPFSAEGLIAPSRKTLPRWARRQGSRCATPTFLHFQPSELSCNLRSTMIVLMDSRKIGIANAGVTLADFFLRRDGSAEH